MMCTDKYFIMNTAMFHKKRTVHFDFKAILINQQCAYLVTMVTADGCKFVL